LATTHGRFLWADVIARVEVAGGGSVSEERAEPPYSLSLAEFSHNMEGAFGLTHIDKVRLSLHPLLGTFTSVFSARIILGLCTLGEPDAHW